MKRPLKRFSVQHDTDTQRLESHFHAFEQEAIYWALIGLGSVLGIGSLAERVRAQFWASLPFFVQVIQIFYTLYLSAFFIDRYLYHMRRRRVRASDRKAMRLGDILLNPVMLFVGLSCFITAGTRFFSVGVGICYVSACVFEVYYSVEHERWRASRRSNALRQVAGSLCLDLVLALGWLTYPFLGYARFDPVVLFATCSHWRDVLDSCIGDGLRTWMLAKPRSTAWPYIFIAYMTVDISVASWRRSGRNGRAPN